MRILGWWLFLSGVAGIIWCLKSLPLCPLCKSAENVESWGTKGTFRCGACRHFWNPGVRR